MESMGDPAQVVFQCSNDITVCGELMIARVTSNTRVLDYLNHSGEEFILLHESAGAVLVNRSHIVLIRDESNAAA